MAEKKKFGALGWILVGCGGLILVGGIAVVGLGLFVGKKAVGYVEDFQENPAATAAETIVRLNPDLELVESDREAGRIRVRQKSTGDEMVFNYEDIQEGRFSFENNDGETTSFDARSAVEGAGGHLTVTTKEGTQTFGATGDAVELPDWLPRFPGGMSDLGGMTQSTANRRNGSVAFATQAQAQEVVDFYVEVMGRHGMTIETSSMAAGTTQILSATGRNDTHSLTVTTTSERDSTRANLVYDGPA